MIYIVTEDQTTKIVVTHEFNTAEEAYDFANKTCSDRELGKNDETLLMFNYYEPITVKPTAEEIAKVQMWRREMGITTH